jgi:DNA-binding MarR family transcriptional regulator
MPFPGDGDEVCLELDTAAARLIDHPNFESAMLASAKALVDLYNGNVVLNRIFSDRGRFAAGLMILDLHFFEGRGAGFSVAQLRREAMAHGFGSPGRMTALVATMRLRGLLRAVEGADRRQRMLTPTETFFALHRARLRLQLEALALIHPEVEQALPHLHDARFLALCAHGFLSPFRRGVRVFHGVAPLQPFAERDAGLVVLFSLLLAERAGEPISIADLARRFSVSRAHVLSTFRVAGDAGLVVRDRERATFRSSPPLVDTLQQLFARLLASYLHAVDYALARTAVAARAPTVTRRS